MLRHNIPRSRMPLRPRTRDSACLRHEMYLRATKRRESRGPHCLRTRTRREQGHTHISHTQNRRGQEGSHTHTHGRCGMVMRLKYRHAWRLRWYAPHAVPAIHHMHQIENVRIVHGMNGARRPVPLQTSPQHHCPGSWGGKTSRFEKSNEAGGEWHRSELRRMSAGSCMLATTGTLGKRPKTEPHRRPG